MVKGLEYFQNHFAPYANHYVLIGGTACSLIMEKAGLSFRATKDLDIVLHVEALDIEFAKSFWQFIEVGGYRHRHRSRDREIFYRFSAPTNENYPSMLELFSRAPDTIKIASASHLTPIPINEAAKSLSAILLIDDYYHFIHSGKQIIDGLQVVSATHLIPLKALAWIDLSDKKNSGVEVDDRDIRKHKNDVLRLYQLLSPATQIPLSIRIKEDMTHFLNRLKDDNSIDIKMLGLKNTTLDIIIKNLKQIYGI